MFLFFTASASSLSVEEFIHAVYEFPSDYIVVVGENVSDEEIDAAQELSEFFGIEIDFDDIEETSNLISIGSSAVNIKTAELGAPSEGDFYVNGTNLFISGNSSFNIQKINEIINSESANNTSNQNTINQTQNVSAQNINNEEINETAEENSLEVNNETATLAKSNPQIIDGRGVGQVNYRTFIPGIILGFIAIIIVILFALMFLKKPKN